VKLKRVKIAGFRGFSDEQAVELGADLIIISGDNYTGKTSLAEALEWLFCGYTVRCRRGKDQYSKIEYRGTYRNIHYPDDERVYVELEALYQDNMITMRRELVDAEDSQAYLDGQPVDDFASLGFSPTASHPVIAQHGLRDFIYTKPSSRREIISYVLGLDSLIQLEKNAQTAHTKYKQERPKYSVTYDRLSTEARQYGVLDSMLNHLRTGSFPEARNDLLREIHKRTGIPDLPENLIPETLVFANLKGTHPGQK